MSAFGAGCAYPSFGGCRRNLKSGPLSDPSAVKGSEFDRRRDTESIDAVFQAEDIETVTSAPRALRRNAPCEKVVGTLRRKALDHVLVWNQAHARRVVESCARHYNGHRPHQAPGATPSSRRTPGCTALRPEDHAAATPDSCPRRPDQRVQIRGLTSRDGFLNRTGKHLRRSGFQRRLWAPAVCGGRYRGETWDPVQQALTFPGLRHSHKTWLIEDGVPQVAQARRLGHIMEDKMSCPEFRRVQ